MLPELYQEAALNCDLPDERDFERAIAHGSCIISTT